MKHKILIDTISLLSPLTGIGRYTYEISKGLAKSEDITSTYFYGYSSKKLLDKAPNVKIKNLIVKNPLIKKIARKMMLLMSRVFPRHYDLYWQPNFIPLTSINAKKIVTSVHDFSFILYRDFHPQERIAYFEKYFLKNVAKSDMIITGSYFTKEEILARLDFKEEQIKVIYHGLNHSLFKIYDDTRLAFEIPKQFILCVGSIEPRKNLLGLLKAYNLLDKAFKSKYKLVLVGFKGWENSEVMELIKQDDEHIHYLGYISDEELAKVYNRASCFVYPSFYEGFGLPPLEAMACATPVVTSDISSIPEVCQDAVVYCDPHDAEDIKEKIELVLKDTLLQEELIQKGLKRASMFTWEKSAKAHELLFLELLS